MYKSYELDETMPYLLEYVPYVTVNLVRPIEQKSYKKWILLRVKCMTNCQWKYECSIYCWYKIHIATIPTSHSTIISICEVLLSRSIISIQLHLFALNRRFCLQLYTNCLSSMCMHYAIRSDFQKISHPIFYGTCRQTA